MNKDDKILYGVFLVFGPILFLLGVFLWHLRWDYVLGGISVGYFILVFLPMKVINARRARKNPPLEF